MTRGNQAGTVAVLTIALAAAWTPALAQQYPPSDPRNPQYQWQQQQEQQRKEQESKEQQRRNEEDSARSSENMRQFMENQRKLQEKISGEVERDRAMFLKTPPVPPEKNRLLGQWKLDKTKKRPANTVAELNAMFSQPACEMVFGDGIWDFRPQALYGNDAGIGEQMLTEVDYRGNEGIVGVVPKTFMRLMIFKILGPDRVQELTSTRIGADPCTFVRFGGNANAQVANARPANAPAAQSGAASRGSIPSNAAAAPPTQMANLAPSPAPTTPRRPAEEICRQTFLDKLGGVGVNQVRQVGDLRYKETLEGKVPNTQDLRIDARGSACDDPRINATLFDFGANGMLQSITYVWARPPGPAPAPIFRERIKTLSLFHSLPPPQSPGRLQADTSVGRLILHDMPERKLLLEAYKSTK